MKRSMWIVAVAGFVCRRDFGSFGRRQPGRCERRREWWRMGVPCGARWNSQPLGGRRRKHAQGARALSA